MKTIYTLTVSLMNGTVTMQQEITAYISIELAEQAQDAVERANRNSEFEVRTSIEESRLYTSAEEVPILQSCKSEPLDV